MHILGISAFYHDSAACLLRDGKIVAAAQEERFTRKRHDAGFPCQAIEYCLSAGKIRLSDVQYVVFYDKPLLKFDRLLETYLGFAPKGLSSFIKSMPVWLKDKLYLKKNIRRELARIGQCEEDRLPRLLFPSHHQSHAASAFFPSPFERAGVLCLDGVGEWATTSVWLGEGNSLKPVWEIRFPHSLGLLYSAFTYYTGFKVNSAEYKVMGLAPYGEPKYVDLIRKNLIDIKEDGSYRLNLRYFEYPVGLRMTNRAFDKLFGAPARDPSAKLTQREMDLARSIQVVTEDVVLKIARTIHRELKVDKLCLAGGVALNCVANGVLVREGPFQEIWVQPAAGDAGGAIGAAYCAWHLYEGKPRLPATSDPMQGAYLGPSYTVREVQKELDAAGAAYRYLGDQELQSLVAEILEKEGVVGWFQGRMEFGPRALGARSILGDPRNPKMQSVMNLKIKHRESFRPFAPAVLAEEASKYFELDRKSPYMMLVAPLKQEYRLPMDPGEKSLFGIDKLNARRSKLPAITHVDFSARVQTVHEETNPRFHALLKEFQRRTTYGVLVNTSFNVRGEPIVCTPEDALRCFMNTEMDYLVIENFLLTKSEQPAALKNKYPRREYELD